MNTPNLKQSLEKTKKAIESADAIVILAGAGMGVDSGIPDFRSESGVWTTYPFFQQENMTVYDIFVPKMFVEHPEAAWGLCGLGLKMFRETEPHAFFPYLKGIVESMKNGYFIFTSNVDGQFQKAGFDPDRIFECHGSMHYVQKLNGEELDSADDIDIEVDEQTLMAKNLPRNVKGDLLRPNVLLFEDDSWNMERADAQQCRYQSWLDGLPNDANLVIIEIGAGLTIPTVRLESWNLQNQKNAFFIQVNPDCDDSSAADVTFNLGALDTYKLWARYGLKGKKR
jgi:NAD-dependent SIR2 family protein deacetylase